jgi:hypothetical protein
MRAAAGAIYRRALAGRGKVLGIEVEPAVVSPEAFECVVAEARPDKWLN